MLQLNTREWALVIWALVALLVILRAGGPRSSLAGVLRALASPKVLLVLLSFLAWEGLLILGASRVGLWNSSLVKDSIAWAVIYTIPMVLATTKVASDPHFFRNAAKSTIAISAIMQFVLNLYTFSLWIELLLQPLIVFLFLVSAVAASKAETASARRFVDALLVLAGLWMVVATGRGLWLSWSGLNPTETALALAFSIWLPLEVLPLVYIVAVFNSYELLLIRMQFVKPNRRPSVGVRAVLLLRMFGRLRQMEALALNAQFRAAVVGADGILEANREVSRFRQALRQKQAEEQLRRVRAVAYIGNPGRRDDGSLLDRREFKETQDALRWIAVCHMGHYRNLGVYRPDLLEVLGDFERQGLPRHHHIQMEVKADGQAWSAWRQTPSGYVLGIGASGPPPSEWLYEGPRAPHGFPGEDPSWGNEEFNLPVNWRAD